MVQAFKVSVWHRVLGVAALLFGVLTLYKSGGVLLDLPGAREAAGNYVPFVVRFNFAAGFFYILAGAGIWLGRRWARGLSAAIALATIAAAVVFGFHVSAGGSYEMQTVGALAVRTGFWLAVFAILLRRG